MVDVFSPKSYLLLKFAGLNRNIPRSNLHLRKKILKDYKNPRVIQRSNKFRIHPSKKLLTCYFSDLSGNFLVFYIESAQDIKLVFYLLIPCGLINWTQIDSMPSLLKTLCSKLKVRSASPRHASAVFQKR